MTIPKRQFNKTGFNDRTINLYKINKLLCSIVLMVCISMPAGCQSFGAAIDSRKIPPGHLLLIPGQGPLNITWESRQLTIAFKGEVDQNILTMDGRIDITGGGIQNLSMVSQLVVQIYFAKSDGSVLDRLNFYSSTKSTSHAILPYAFSRSFELPKGTTHIAFGYDGTVGKGGSGAGDVIEHSFQHSPFR
jgi:hypothetical protein